MTYWQNPPTTKVEAELRAELSRLRATNARLAEALRGLMKYEGLRAKYSGLSDCTCIGMSREYELAYETDKCPHQVARAAIAAAEGGGDAA